MEKERGWIKSRFSLLGGGFCVGRRMLYSMATLELNVMGSCELKKRAWEGKTNKNKNNNMNYYYLFYSMTTSLLGVVLRPTTIATIGGIVVYLSFTVCWLCANFSPIDFIMLQFDYDTLSTGPPTLL